jgi:catechol 2,3-dioxygenase-like lactoylglutathione lyase family enzyme
VHGVDHVVVMTPDLERTSAAFTAVTGAPLKRVRDAGANTRQGFHRLNDVVIEMVSSPNVPEGPARLWGFVLTVRGLDEAARYLGPDVLSPPKPAVQEGRRIATFRQAAGLGVPVALMD